ncbi:hypothetical protein OIU76_025839 [Salix suchowensis]|nr:hypothetical protein OIU76_025839 [Salix suchowensis]
MSPKASFSPKSFQCRSSLSIINNAKSHDNGKFFAWDGQEIPCLVQQAGVGLRSLPVANPTQEAVLHGAAASFMLVRQKRKERRKITEKREFMVLLLSKQLLSTNSCTLLMQLAVSVG